MVSFKLSSVERIKSKKDFEVIYSSGTIFYSSDYKLKAIFVKELNAAEPSVKIAAAVNRKSGNAVWRNRVKRLIKESYRLNKHILLPIAIEKKVQIKVVFSAYHLNKKNNNFVKLSDIFPNLVELMHKIADGL